MKARIENCQVSMTCDFSSNNSAKSELVYIIFGLRGKQTQLSVECTAEQTLQKNGDRDAAKTGLFYSIFDHV